MGATEFVFLNKPLKMDPKKGHKNIIFFFIVFSLQTYTESID